MSSIRVPCPSSSCCYIKNRHRGFFKDQLSELNAYDAVIKEMKEECSYNGNEDEDYDTRIFSSMDSSFNCCPFTTERDGYKYFHGQAASPSPPTFHPSDYDICWPDEKHLPSKYRTRSLRCEADDNQRRHQGNDNNEDESQRKNKPKKTYHYTVFH